MQTTLADSQEDTDSLPDGLDADTVFDLLSNQRRRFAIAIVARHGQMDVSELAEYVAARETGTPVGEVDADARKRVYVGLYQCHLPKIDAAGVLVHDRETGQVSQGPRLDAVAWYLDNGPAADHSTAFETARKWLSRRGVA